MRLRTDGIEVEVVPGKGGDILAVRAPGGPNVLYETPWGLPHRGTLLPVGGSHAAFLDQYPGGWQTLFPNAGAEGHIGGALQPFHGEATLVAWDHEVDGADLVLTTRLRRSPFALHRRVSVTGDTLRVVERFENVGAAPVAAIWSHHPAFGGPLIGPGAVMDAPACTVLVEEQIPAAGSGVAPGARAPWPTVPDGDGRDVDLRRIPQVADGIGRMHYLVDIGDGPVTIRNADAGVGVELDWDRRTLPAAWVWTEAGATKEAPFFGTQHAFAVEPTTTAPDVGIDRATATGVARTFEPGVPQEAWVTLRVTSGR